MEDVKIPKFGSFRPKLVKKPKNRTDEVARDEATFNRANDPHHTHEIGHREESRRTLDKDKYTHHSRYRDFEPEAKRGYDEDWSQESRLFFIDRRGDHQNIQYGSMHRADVPSYHRAGNGGIIGRSPLARIDKNTSTDRGVYLKASGSHSSTETRRPLMSKHGKPNESKYKFVVNNLEIDNGFDGDFVSLQRSSKRRRVSAEAEGMDVESSHPDYRSIEGKAKPQARLEDDVMEAASDSGVNEDRLDLELAARQENSRLLRQARAAPLDINSWLQLIAHQVQLVHAGADATGLTTSQRRSLAELRLSILNEALKHTTKGHAHRGLLLLKSLDEGVFLWDKAKLESRWKEALLDCPDDFLLYQNYLDHVQGEPSAFTFEKCKLAFSEGLKLLARTKLTQDPHMRSNKVGLLTRLIGFVQDSGYDELATAIWQVILECRFFRPSQLSMSNRSKFLDSLEDFWESDVPRIGEHDANGWARFFESSQGPKRASHALDTPMLNPIYPLATFAEEESRLSVGYSLPASADDEDAEDPFRFVMFKDLDGIVEHVDTDLPENTILNAFLGFHGLPSMAVDDTTHDIGGLTNDPFLAGHGFRYMPNRAFNDNNDGLGSQSMPSRLETTLLLFRDSFEPFISRSKMDQQPHLELTTFLDRALDSLASVLPENEALAEYVLAWKFHMFPEAAVKTAKRLLKARPSSLRLYNAFALLEVARGRLERGREVWSTAVKMCSSLPLDAQAGKILLWHDSALTLAQHKKEEIALDSLLETISDGHTTLQSTDLGPRSASQLLRTTQTLTEDFTRTLTSGDIHRATLYADCLIWLSYLSDGFDISTALANYRQLQNNIVEEADVVAAELLAQCKATLLELHLTQKRPFRPTAWEQELSDDLSRYPSNSILLELHDRMASHDRLHRIMQEQRIGGPTRDTIVRRRFLISQEFRRLHSDGSGSNVNTIRALFNQALLDPESITKHSVDLWILWLRIEYQYATSLPKNSVRDPLQRAKQVFLHGLRHLPWSKPWALLGMSIFGREETYQPELRQVYQTILERGMRIRIDVDNT